MNEINESTRIKLIEALGDLEEIARETGKWEFDILRQAEKIANALLEIDEHILDR